MKRLLAVLLIGFAALSTSLYASETRTITNFYCSLGMATVKTIDLETGEIISTKTYRGLSENGCKFWEALSRTHRE